MGWELTAALEMAELSKTTPNVTFGVLNDVSSGWNVLGKVVEPLSFAGVR
jgi:hypothetical protein